MALTEKQASEIKEFLDNCRNPLFFYDDDQDGLCAFLQLYRYKKEGHGIIIKSSPKLEKMFLRKIEETNPDVVFILDIATVDQEFLDSVKVPVVWIDHHGPYERRNVNYYNPRVQNQEDNFPTSYLCYQVVKQDLWIATLGSVADWHVPEFINEFREKYPGLVDDDFKSAPEIIFDSKLGKLIRIFSFVIKGKTQDVLKCIDVLTKIKDPYEILEKKSDKGKFIFKRFQKVNVMYEALWNDLKESFESDDEKLLLYTYKDDQWSFTSDLSNEAIYRFSEKIIMIAREKNGEMKGSIRSTKIILPPLIEKALIGLHGYGGGHEHACGFNVKKEDFEAFVKRIREQI